jgi:hypothetical protein
MKRYLELRAQPRKGPVVIDSILTDIPPRSSQYDLRHRAAEIKLYAAKESGCNYLDHTTVTHTVRSPVRNHRGMRLRSCLFYVFGIRDRRYIAIRFQLNFNVKCQSTGGGISHDCYDSSNLFSL